MLLDLYRQASDWALSHARSVDLAGPSSCDQWTNGELISHMVKTQQYFVGAARGEQGAPQLEPEPLDGDPVTKLTAARDELLSVFSDEATAEQAGPSLGIAFSDMLLHGWDLARAAGADATMPDGLAEAAYDAIHGQFSDDQRTGVFAPEIAVADDATPQQRLLAYTGRQPS